MTDEQQEQWNKHGCGPRCLIAMSRERQIPITADQILDAFLPKYPQWVTKCGSTVTSMLIDIARHFGLCSQAHVFRTTEEILTLAKNNQLAGVLAFTECTSSSHCWLLARYLPDTEEFLFADPAPNGQNYPHTLPSDVVNQRFAYFLALF